MENVFEYLRQLNIVSMMLRIVLAVVMGGLLGLERERKSSPAGFRTYMLVAIGSTVTMMLSQYLDVMLQTRWLAQAQALGVQHDVSRFGAQVINGVGFLGAGTIFMTERKISGLTTAASLWCTACIGLAVGSGFILMGVMAGAIVLVILRLMQRIVHVNTLKRLEVQFIHRTQTLAFLNDYFSSMGVKVLDVDFHAENRPEGNLYTNLYTLSMPSHTSYVDIIGTLSEHQNIRTVRTRNL